jgi:eukaryotic translation initiation factor 2C
MPPRIAQAGSRGARGGRGGPRGAAPPVGFTTSSHIITVGVKRPNFGSSGRELPVYVNSFVTTVPEGNIHHYDGM